MITSEFLLKFIRDAIAFRRDDSYSVRGRLIPGDTPTDVILTLSPGDAERVINHELVVPREVDGVPVRIAEQPARVNKPTGRYMCSAMVGGDSRPGRRGRLWLAEVTSWRSGHE